METQSIHTGSIAVEKQDENVAYVSQELAELIPWFLDNRRKDVQNIEQLIAQSDFTTLARVGHTLKGTCPGYGFDYLGRVGADIEKAAKAQDVQSVRDLNEKMRRHLDEVKVVYK